MELHLLVSLLKPRYVRKLGNGPETDKEQVHTLLPYKGVGLIYSSKLIYKLIINKVWNPHAAHSR